MSEISVGPPTVKDYGVAIEILKQAGLAGVKRAVLLGGSNAEGERLAEAAESLARVVHRLRALRDEIDGDPEWDREDSLMEHDIKRGDYPRPRND